MKRDKVEIYLHFVWTTWDRLPLLTPDVEAAAFRIIGAECLKQNCLVLALNGTEDHVHLLVKIRTTNRVDLLMKSVRGDSSRGINLMAGQGSFRWRGGFGVFSVSRWDVRKIIDYIRTQKERHASGDVLPQLEPDDGEEAEGEEAEGEE